MVREMVVLEFRCGKAAGSKQECSAEPTVAAEWVVERAVERAAGLGWEYPAELGYAAVTADGKGKANSCE